MPSDFDISKPTKGEQHGRRLTYADICREAADEIGGDVTLEMAHSKERYRQQYATAAHLRTLALLLDGAHLTLPTLERMRMFDTLEDHAAIQATAALLHCLTSPLPTSNG